MLSRLLFSLALLTAPFALTGCGGDSEVVLPDPADFPDNPEPVGEQSEGETGTDG